MPKNFNAAALLVLGASAFLFWYVTSSIWDLERKVQDLETTLSSLQVRQGPSGASGATSGGDSSEQASNRASKAKAKAKAKKGGQGGGKNRGTQMAEVLAAFAAEKSLDEATTTGLEKALTTLNEGVRAVRAANPDGDQDTMREQRQALFAEFEASVKGLLDAELAEALLAQIKTNRGAGQQTR